MMVFLLVSLENTSHKGVPKRKTSHQLKKRQTHKTIIRFSKMGTSPGLQVGGFLAVSCKTIQQKGQTINPQLAGWAALARASLQRWLPPGFI